jgi:hypothetical protein
MKGEEISFTNIPEFQNFSNQMMSYTVSNTTSQSKILYTNSNQIKVLKKFSTLLEIPRIEDWVLYL